MKDTKILKLDDPVIVWDIKAFGVYKMHFAKFNHNGQIETFRGGRTSWSGNYTKIWENYETIQNT
jgi:hypothetical protein